MPPATPRVLAIVRYGLLRADPRLMSLDHVADLLTSFLDVSGLISLEKAASSGSVLLFDRVASRLIGDSHVNSALREYWFAQSLKVAIERDDLPMIQHVHAFHASPLYVYDAMIGSTYAFVLRYGSLATVQWVFENRSDRSCCPAGIENICRGCLIAALFSIRNRDPFRIVMWLVKKGAITSLDSSMLMALKSAMEHSTDLVRWVRERAVIDNNQVLSFLEIAITQRRVDDALYLAGISTPSLTASLQSIRCLVAATCCGLDDVVSKLLSDGHCHNVNDKFTLASVRPGGRKILQWDPDFLGRPVFPDRFRLSYVISDVASRCGDLETLQWIYDVQMVTPDFYSLRPCLQDPEKAKTVFQWMVNEKINPSAILMDVAAATGHLQILKWLHELPNQGGIVEALEVAAANGHLDIVKWLLEVRMVKCSWEAVSNAVRNNCFEVVQYLNDQWYPATRDEVFLAAQAGHLDLLIWLLEYATADICTTCLTDSTLHGLLRSRGGPRSFHVLKWLQTQPRGKPCLDCQRIVRERPSPKYALVSAVENGDLVLAKYLMEAYQDHVHMQYVGGVVSTVVHRGHLPLLLWMYDTFCLRDNGDTARFPRWDGDWRDAAEKARSCSHVHIAEWIESCRRDSTDG